MLKDIFGFAKCQEKATFGLDYKLTQTRNNDEVVIDKAAGIADAWNKIHNIHWYVSHYTPSVQEQSFLSNQILKKMPTELIYIERYVFMKEVNNQNLWNFELGSHEIINIPIWIIVGFQQRKTRFSKSE